MLELRLASGAPLVTAERAMAAPPPARGRGDGLLELRDDHAILTLRGRLIADTVVRDLSA